MHWNNFLFFLSLAFVGHPQAVIEAALAAGRAAYNLIDMTRHTGEHPRVGAMVIKKFIENIIKIT